MKHKNITEIIPQGVSHNPSIMKRLLVANKEIPHLTNFTQSVFKPDDTAPSHAHKDMYEIFLVESGTGIAIINGKEQQLNQGDCLVIELNEEHEIKNTGSIDLILTYFGIEV